MICSQFKFAKKSKIKHNNDVIIHLGERLKI